MTINDEFSQAMERAAVINGAMTTSADVYWDTCKGIGIAGMIWEERLRQLSKWGLQTRPSGTDAAEWKPRELAVKDEYERAIDAGELTWIHILREEVYEAFAEEDPEKLAVELVQVMAVAASWLQDMILKGEISAQPAAA